MSTPGGLVSPSPARPPQLAASLSPLCSLSLWALHRRARGLGGALISEAAAFLSSSSDAGAEVPFVYFIKKIKKNCHLSVLGAQGALQLSRKKFASQAVAGLTL